MGLCTTYNPSLILKLFFSGDRVVVFSGAGCASAVVFR